MDCAVALATCKARKILRNTPLEIWTRDLVPWRDALEEVQMTSDEWKLIRSRRCLNVEVVWICTLLGSQIAREVSFVM
jgi:hypothetical protein